MSESTAEQVKERVGEGAQQVQEKASEAKERTRERLSAQIDSRSTQAGEQMTRTADALRQTAQQLRGDHQAQPAQLLEGVAQRVEKLGQYLAANDRARLPRSPLHEGVEHTPVRGQRRRHAAPRADGAGGRRQA